MTHNNLLISLISI